ncbi:DUF3891 family protein [Haladaptatus salinisoli]|uniref:DUF3891 family protein n=1 Tax=Haladaptatus salinisoli TaxID=2884876 RepID=UPI001D0A0388|nr:DUF3891 family protein [Haladaptatus salinisoli]
MIVAERENSYRFITQPDHADLSGQFAERWGNDEVERPKPSPPMVLAAYTHDNGWWEYDLHPHLDEDGEPIGFTRIPADAWIDCYDRGVDNVVEMDPYAGLVVSMHGTGLRRRRYGLSPSMPDLSSEFAAFVRRQEERQERLLAELRDANRHGWLSEADESFLAALHERGTPPEDYDGRLWFDYKLLQAWDTLSLSFCTTESPPGYDPIGAVPTAPGAPDETLSIAALGGDEFRVEPWPFEESPVRVSVPARTVSKSDFDGEDGLVRAYYGSERETVTFTLRR